MILFIISFCLVLLVGFILIFGIGLLALGMQEAEEIAIYYKEEEL